MRPEQTSGNRLRKRMFVALLLLVTSLASVWAQAAIDETISVESLDGFCKRTVKRVFEESKAVGGVFVIVDEDGILYDYAYGVEDLENQKPITPNESRFRIGSITKTMTALAAVKLMEQGKLDSSEDVSKYLKSIKIKNKYTSKITMEHLLTHRSGLDTSEIVYLFREPKDYATVGEAMADLRFITKSEPGAIASYNNYGLALVGAVIEDTTGIPYDDFIRDSVFKPLGMASSLPGLDSLDVPEKTRITREYSYDEGSYKPLEAYSLAVGPAGSVVSTGADMARYMRFFLSTGESATGTIVSGDWISRMLDVAYAPSERLDGVCMGFYESTIGGRRFVGHDGGTLGTSSQMLLDIDRKIGIFYSATVPPELQEEVDMTAIEREFVSSFYAPIAEEPFYGGKSDSLEGLDGYYVPERSRNVYGVERILSLLSYKKITTDGTNILIGDLVYGPLGGNLYKNGEKNQIICVDASNHAIYSKQTLQPYGKIMEGISPYMTSLCLVAFILIGVGYLIVAGILRLMKKRLDKGITRMLKANSIAVIFFLLACLVFIISFSEPILKDGTRNVMLLIYNGLSFVALMSLIVTLLRGLASIVFMTERSKAWIVGLPLAILCGVVSYILISNNMISLTRGI